MRSIKDLYKYLESNSITIGINELSETMYSSYYDDSVIALVNTEDGMYEMFYDKGVWDWDECDEDDFFENNKKFFYLAKDSTLFKKATGLNLNKIKKIVYTDTSLDYYVFLLDTKFIGGFDFGVSNEDDIYIFEEGRETFGVEFIDFGTSEYKYARDDMGEISRGEFIGNYSDYEESLQTIQEGMTGWIDVETGYSNSVIISTNLSETITQNNWIPDEIESVEVEVEKLDYHINDSLIEIWKWKINNTETNPVDKKDVADVLESELDYKLDSYYSEKADINNDIKNYFNNFENNFKIKEVNGNIIIDNTYKIVVDFDGEDYSLGGVEVK